MKKAEGKSNEEKLPSEFSEWFKLLEKKSTLRGLLRSTAFLLRIFEKVKSKNEEKSFRKEKWFKIDKEKGLDISSAELDRARLVWIYIVQRSYFGKEIGILEKKNSLKGSYKLLPLNPVLNEGLLRVGGRLKHSLLQYDEKHPLILPSEGHFAELVIRDCHAKVLHGGAQLTLNTLRQNYWILKGRQKVKSVIQKCTVCIRYRASQQYQLMGNLPADRVRPGRPFSQSGVEYAGPYLIRASHGRGRIAFKGYICIFVCLSTKAVHLEAVSSYDTQAFIAAFRRFCSRRGHCQLLRSDQGTNFVGADKELRSMYEKSSDHVKQLKMVLAQEGTSWHFNPAAAPNFGGLWEAAVKSTKHHLKRVIGEHKLTFEEFTTLLAQIEACLNSRPLTTLTDDPLDEQPLTPAHFLIQSNSYILPEPNYLDEKIPLTKRWKLVQQMLQSFWQRWSAEYLQSLQHRGKWQTSQRPITVGDITLVIHETTPPAQWPLARVVAIHVGSDGLPRVADLRIARKVDPSSKKKISELQRPVSKLILLVPSET